jgi:nitrogen fixation protein
MFYRGNMKESYIETTDNEKLPVTYFEIAAYIIDKDSTEGIMHITDEDGDEYDIVFKSYYRVHFIELPTLEQKQIDMKQSFTIKFNWRQHANVDMDYVLVEKEKGISVVIPSICFGFDYLSGMGGRNTARVPNFENGLTLPSKKIYSFEITDKKSLGGWYQWGISIDIVKKNGEKIPAYTSGNIQVVMLTANGAEYLHLQYIKRIVYLSKYRN